MKIYDIENFPNPMRVRIALAEKQAIDQVQFINVDVMAGEHRLDSFLAKNPLAGVPVLELDDGTIISECTAITEYIDQHIQGISLTGESAKQRAVIQMMQRRAEIMVLDAVAGYFHHATTGLGEQLETYQNEDWGLKQKQRAIEGFDYFNSLLSNQDYVAGNHYSMADITLYAGLAFADFAQVSIPEHCSHLIQWRTRISQRPAINA
jgi:glutathione S-transferase